jgi:hypothetical protein
MKASRKQEVEMPDSVHSCTATFQDGTVVMFVNSKERKEKCKGIESEKTEDMQNKLQ